MKDSSENLLQLQKQYNPKLDIFYEATFQKV